jgi:hypothetical protein|tara:strand:+ start:153 stop:770 length:618 start_codon:yes stop_codon:yes gene_type:complete
MQCCRSKRGRTELFRDRGSIFQSLDKIKSIEFSEARSRIRSKYPDRFKDTCLSALSLYDGTLYSSELKKEITNNLDDKFDLLIMSGGYGLVRPDEIIEDYDINISKTSSYWKRYLPIILNSYLKSKGINEIDGVFSQSAAYMNIARDIQSFLKANSSVQFRIFYLDFHGGGAQRIVPDLQSELLLKLFRGKTPHSIKDVPVRIET